MIKDVTNDPTQWKRFWESDDGVYHGIANPNATNSELDAKVIITQPELTDYQRDELTEQYVELVVDGMETKDLVRYAIEQLTSYYNEGSIDDLKEDINNYDDNDGLYEELVENILIEELTKEV